MPNYFTLPLKLLFLSISYNYVLSCFLGQFGNGVLSFFLFLKWLLFLDLLIFIIQFSFISIPKLVLEPDVAENGSCPATQNKDYTTGRNAGNLIVDFMTGQVSSSLITG